MKYVFRYDESGEEVPIGMVMLLLTDGNGKHASTLFQLEVFKKFVADANITLELITKER